MPTHRRSKSRGSLSVNAASVLRTPLPKSGIDGLGASLSKSSISAQHASGRSLNGSLSHDVPSFEGWLAKKAHSGISGMRIWQSRFFALDHTGLSWYEDEQRGARYGHIPLTMMVDAAAFPEKSPGRFRVRCRAPTRDGTPRRDSRTAAFKAYDLEAESLGLMRRWVELIERQLSRQGVSVPNGSSPQTPEHAAESRRQCSVDDDLAESSLGETSSPPISHGRFDDSHNQPRSSPLYRGTPLPNDAPPPPPPDTPPPPITGARRDSAGKPARTLSAGRKDRHRDRPPAHGAAHTQLHASVHSPVNSPARSPSHGTPRNPHRLSAGRASVGERSASAGRVSSGERVAGCGDGSAERTRHGETVQRALLAVRGNDVCADCVSASPEAPMWASTNLGVVLCIRCCGVHRKLGAHISKVLSIRLDNWSDAQLAHMRRLGNEAVNAELEAQLKPGVKPDLATCTPEYLEGYIRAKYQHGSFRRGGDGHIPKIEPISDFKAAMTEFSGLLFIKLVCGSNLPSLDSRTFSKLDAYVEFSFGDRRCRSKTCRKSLNPRWGEQLSMNTKRSDETLVIKVFSASSVFSDTEIGQARVELSELPQDGEEMGYDLTLVLTKAAAARAAAPASVAVLLRYNVLT
mmetsp:Transcript_33584/g.73696  ORF Transcript_33584/g.73696 Transcript_33584/m.73696 type:complete len:631 (+) Transcript_33584:118-2010(+)